VLKAHQPAFKPLVANNVLSAAFAPRGVARKKLAREAQAAAAVVHDHVVPVHAVDADASPPFLVMAFIAGQSLQQRLDRCGPLDTKEILRIGMQTAAGLAAAHAQGLVHRDVKPANIMLENGIERVRITDFGLARAIDDASVTQNGAVAGTPQYMAPEQGRGEPIDQRADLFALGSVLYAMATGRAPFFGDCGLTVIRQVCDAEPVAVRSLNPDIPPWLAGIIGKLHQKDPNKRFQSAADVATLLEGCLAHLQEPRTHPLPRQAVELGRALGGGDRRRGTSLAWAAVSLPLVLAAGWFLAKHWSTNPHSESVGPPVELAPPSIETAEILAWDKALRDGSRQTRARLGQLHQSFLPQPPGGAGWDPALWMTRNRVQMLQEELTAPAISSTDPLAHDLARLRHRLETLRGRMNHFSN
jgi:serine/threonine protein kinase